MMDLCEKGSGSGSENGKKICSDCKTTKTPLWRGGPDGPKSLCNACGIRHRKKRRALMGLNKGVGGGNGTEKKRKEKERRNGVSSISSLKLKLMGLKSEVLLKRLDFEKQKKLGEEEQAAVLLMALSCGAVYG